jgi:hypothetical protein
MIAVAVMVVGLVLATLGAVFATRPPRRYATSGDSSPMLMDSGGGGDWSTGSSDCSPGDSGGGSDGGCGDGGGGDGGGGGD